VTLFSRFR